MPTYIYTTTQNFGVGKIYIFCFFIKTKVKILKAAFIW